MRSIGDKKEKEKNKSEGTNAFLQSQEIFNSKQSNQMHTKKQSARKLAYHWEQLTEKKEKKAMCKM